MGFNSAFKGLKRIRCFTFVFCDGDLNSRGKGYKATKSLLPFAIPSNNSCLWLNKYNKRKESMALRRVHSAVAERALTPDDQVRSQQVSGRSHINPTRRHERPKTPMIMIWACKNDNHHKNIFFF